MKKIILGWFLNLVITVVGFFVSTVVLGFMLGIVWAISGNEWTMSDEELAALPIFGVFCFVSVFACNLFGYWFTVRKVIER